MHFINKSNNKVDCEIPLNEIIEESKLSFSDRNISAA